jgi:hypothetical protein
MPNALVTNKDGTLKYYVKNLGWLLHHSHLVDRFESMDLMESPGYDTVLIAHMRNGGSFAITWASKELMLKWLHRPVFRGLKITLNANEEARSTRTL